MVRRIVEQYQRVYIYTKDPDTKKEEKYFDGVFYSVTDTETKIEKLKEKFGKDLKFYWDIYWKDEREIYWEDKKSEQVNQYDMVKC